MVARLVPWVGRRQLRLPPHTVEVDGFRVEYHAFGTPELAGRTPVVFLGGAFQSSWSFRHEVERLAPSHPVVLLDLPGQGQNAQQAAELDFDDLAQLLGRALWRMELDRVHIVGLSYGSGIAHAFASHHPDRVARSILGGVTRRARPMLRRILEHGIQLVDEGDLDAFAYATAHHLFNPSKTAHTGVDEAAIMRLCDGIRSLDPEAHCRFRHNTARLLRSTLTGAPACETLVYSARYDNFVMPHEAFEVARSCPRAVFAMFTSGDHLLPLEHPRALVELYAAFLGGEPLVAVPGIELVDPKTGSVERRIEPRRPCHGIEVVVRDAAGDELVGVVDVTHDGCLVGARGARGTPTRGARHAVLEAPAVGLEVPVVVEDDPVGARCVFIKSSPRAWSAICRLVQECEMRDCA